MTKFCRLLLLIYSLCLPQVLQAMLPITLLDHPSHWSFDTLENASSGYESDDEEREFPLHAAIEADDIERVKDLINAKVDVNEYKGNLKTTPLIAAVKKGSLEIVQLLLAAKADIDKQDLTASPLCRAVEKQDEAMVELLLAARADPNRKCCLDFPLHEAARWPNGRILRMLLEAGADPKARDINFNCTPMDNAAWHSQIGNAQILYSYGSDIDSLEKLFVMAEYANASKKHETARYIRQLPAFTQGLKLSRTAFAVITHARCNNCATRIIAPESIQKILAYLHPKACVYDLAEVNHYAEIVPQQPTTRLAITDPASISRKRKCPF